MIIESLIKKALWVRDRAYVPYSNYPVGAALLTEAGHIFYGCNVENVSYGLTICAERSAVVQAVAAGEKGFTAIAIAGDLQKPSFPCGACLQVLAEFNKSMTVYLVTDEKIIEKNLTDLLPYTFSI